MGSLRFVALTFTQLQEDRHFADYNLTKDLDPTDALNQVKSAEKIFNVKGKSRVFKSRFDAVLIMPWS